MATTEERLQEVEHLEELLKQPSASVEAAGVDPADRGEQAVRPIRDWSRLLLTAWLVVLTALLIFEPRPADSATTPAWGVLLVLVFTYTLLAAMIGLAIRRPWGLGTSAIAGGLGMVIAGACAATGHHAGGWAMIEGVAFTGLAVGSLAALRAR